MHLKSQAKRYLLRYSPGQRFWTYIRRRSLLKDYLDRRESYFRVAQERGISYSESAATERVRTRLSKRGYSPTRRTPGEIHTFAVIPNLGWHSALLPDLSELGPVTRFDYVSHGFQYEQLNPPSAKGLAHRRKINELMLSELRNAHAARPVDWVFVYESGVELRADAVRRIRDELGIPVVGMCLDDKQSWRGPMLDDHHAGQIGLARDFDLAWTSARVACEWYLVEGGNPIFLPEGFDSSSFYPMEIERDTDVSFVGGAYGFRPQVVEHLKRSGVRVRTFGPGWDNPSVWGEAQVRIFNQSRVNLGMGGIGYSEQLTNVKTRDFEIPGTGGGVYLTSYNPDLAQFFDIGTEILCYSTRIELVELIRYYLARPNEASEISARARSRCLSEHRWLHRYETILKALDVMAQG